MDRRLFLRGLLGIAGAAATMGLAIPEVEATIFDQLKNPLPLPDDKGGGEVAGRTPDGTAVEPAYRTYGHYRRVHRRVHRRHYRRYRRYRRRICRWDWRYGRRYRRCYWGWY
jgi:hypothetical protein